MKQLKLLILLISTLTVWQVNAQTGASCATAISITQPSTQTYTSTGVEKWYEFAASSQTLTLAVKEKFNQVNVSKIELYTGTCSNLKLLAMDSLTFPSDSIKKVTSTSLNIGKTYYVRVCFIDNQTSNTFGLITSPAIIPLCSFCVNDFDTGETLGCYGGCVNPVPTITICQGQEICLSSDCSDEFPQQFDFSNGDPSVSATSWNCAYYNPTTIGLITVSMPTSVLAECSGVICYINVLGTTPPPLFSIDPPNPMCIGTCLTLTSDNDPTTIIGYQFNTPTSTNIVDPDWSNVFYCTTFLTPGINQIEYVLNPGKTCSVVATYDAIVLEPEITLLVTGADCSLNKIFTASINCTSNSLLPITYNWHIYSGTSNTAPLLYTSLNTLNVLNYSFAAPGNYYVEVSSSSGGLTGQIITVGSGTPPIINITSSSTNLCSLSAGNILTLNPNTTLGTGDVINWVASNANTAAVLTIPYTMGANGIINYNFSSLLNYPDPINFCVEINSFGCISKQCITLYPCCPAQAGFININSVTYTSNTNLGAGNYIFNGVITVNPGVTLTIDKAQVLLNPNTKINVRNGARLKIDKSWLHACAAMWEGIYLYNNSEIVIQAGSLIEDAKRAIVDTLGAAKIKTGDMVFNKNHTALILKKNTTTSNLRFDQTAISSSNLVPNVLPTGGYSTSSYVNNAPLLSSLIAQKMLPPYNTLYGQYGVILIGTKETGGNNVKIKDITFDKIYQGVFSLASKLTITNSIFQNHTVSLHPSGQPAGVYISNFSIFGSTPASEAQIGSNSPVNNCEFINNNYGVYSTGPSQIDVLRNTFTAQKIAILLTSNNKNKQVTIDRNKINQCQVGIDLFNNFWIKADVTENRLDNTASIVGAYNTNYAIFTGEFSSVSGNPTNFARYKMYNNYIDGYYNGIFVSNTYKTEVTENEVHLRPDNNPGNFQMGIRLENTNSILVNTNTITKVSPDNTAWWQFGVFADNNTIPVIACNSISNIYASIKLQMPNYTSAGTGIVANVMSNANHGIWMDANAEIGDQFLNLFGTLYNSDNQWNNMNASQTFVSGNSNQTSVPGNNIPSRMFTQGSGGGAFFLDNTNALLGTGLFNSPLLGVYTLPSFGGGINCAGNTPTPLLRLMQRANNIAASNLTFGVNQANLDLMSKRALHKNLKAENINLSLPANAALKIFAANNYSTSIGKLFLVDSLIQAANVNDNVSLLNNAQSINNTIANSCLIEQNQIWLNNLYIRLQTNMPDSTELFMLEQLAIKCPQYDGEAVYQARSLLMNYTFKSYNSICDQDNPVVHGGVGNRMAQVMPLAIGKTNEVSLYPNPTAKDITVEYIKGEDAEAATLTIYNMVGELLISKTLQDAKTTITIDELSSGIYLYFIKQGNQTLKTNKLVLTK
jgi:hypothetical protein